MNTEFITRTTAGFFSKLPTYWKLATIRCGVYAVIVGANAFMAGVEGYASFAEMTAMQIGKLIVNILVAVLTTWLAFLDSTMSKVAEKGLTEKPSDAKVSP